jgi:hypothetical protein
VSWLFVLLNQMFKVVKEILALDEQNNLLLKQNAAKLDRILFILEPPQPVKFVITLLGENMTKPAVSHNVKVTFQTDGTAKAVAAPTDQFGVATTLPAGASTPAWKSSDPGLVATLDLTADPTGLTAKLTPATPPVAVTGASVSVSSTLADGSTVIQGTSDPADPINITGSAATGFKVTQGAA